MKYLNIDVLTKYDLVGWAHAEELPDAWQQKLNQTEGEIELDIDFDVFFDHDGVANVVVHHVYADCDAGYIELKADDINFFELAYLIANDKDMEQVYARHLREMEG